MWPTWNGIDGGAIGAGARCRRFWKVYLCISGGEFPSICLILLVLIQLPSAVEVAACRESDKSGNIITISAAKFEDGTVCAWGGYNGQTICAPLATSHSSVDQVFAPDGCHVQDTRGELLRWVGRRRRTGGPVPASV